MLRIISAAIMLSACAQTTQNIPTPVTNISVMHPTPPRSIEPKPVEFIIVTSETMDRLEDGDVWYAMRVKSYENLSYNLNESIRYIRDQQALIAYYKNILNSD